MIEKKDVFKVYNFNDYDVTQLEHSVMHYPCKLIPSSDSHSYSDAHLQSKFSCLKGDLYRSGGDSNVFLVSNSAGDTIDYVMLLPKIQSDTWVKHVTKIFKQAKALLAFGHNKVAIALSKEKNTFILGILMPFYARGDFANWLQKVDWANVEPKVIYSWFKSLLRALGKLHTHNYMHGDCSPVNFLITSEEQVDNIKLIACDASNSHFFNPQTQNFFEQELSSAFLGLFPRKIQYLLTPDRQLNLGTKYETHNELGLRLRRAEKVDIYVYNTEYNSFDHKSTNITNMMPREFYFIKSDIFYIKRSIWGDLLSIVALLGHFYARSAFFHAKHNQSFSKHSIFYQNVIIPDIKKAYQFDKKQVSHSYGANELLEDIESS